MARELPDLQSFYDRHSVAVSAVHFLLGAALTLAFAPFNLYLLAPLLAAVVLFNSYCLAPRSAARFAFWFAFGHFLTGTYWIYISVHVIGHAPLWVAFGLMLGLVAIMASYFAGTAWLMARLVNRRPVRLVVAGPAIWVVIEWLRGWFLSGFPWLSIGYSQTDSPLASWAPLFGIYGVSWVLLVSASGLVIAAVNRRYALALSLVLIPWLIGFGLRSYEWTLPFGEPVVTTIVQGGVPQEDKWEQDQFLPTLELYHNALAEVDRSTLVVWPEVAIPTVIDPGGDYLAVIQEQAATKGTTLVMGMLESDREIGQIFNSVALVEAGGIQVYRKRHLVPFGEYFPVPDFVREWMRFMELPNTDIAAGADDQPILVASDGNKMGVAICYEDAYGAEQLYALPEATLMINVSNDGWFGDSIAAFQHLQIARMRALEVERWVVRATNNGMSAFIGPRGEIIAMAPRFEFATLEQTVQPRAGLTPYARTGNLSILLLLCLMIAWTVWRNSKKSINI